MARNCHLTLPSKPKQFKYYLMGTGFEEKTPLFTVLKRTCHVTNPAFDHLLLQFSFPVRSFAFYFYIAGLLCYLENKPEITAPFKQPFPGVL